MSAALDLGFVVAATGGRVARAPGRAATGPFAGVAIDGRKVEKGGLWFAIRGARFDGHDFAHQAVASGAAGLVVERGRAAGLSRVARAAVIEVDDTTRALGVLARAHRLRLPSLRVVGVTGSNGKTTTKELVFAVLHAHAEAQGLDAAVHKTGGNFNNHLGLPLTLLQLTDRHRYAVIEMGMSARGEIAYLAELCRPDLGIIVNVGPVHLETLGTVDEVARAKGELFAALSPAGVAIYPAAPDGDPRIAEQAQASRAVRKIRFGTAPGMEVRLESAALSAAAPGGRGAIGTEVKLRLPDGARVEARLQAVGRHHGLNAAAAAAAGYALGVPAAAIARGLASAGVEKHRSTVIDAGGRMIMDDCYNASPLSMRAALDTLVALRESAGGRAFALLGDMLELGPDEGMLHRSIGERAAALNLDRLITVGERARHIADGALFGGLPPERVSHAASVEAAVVEAALADPGDIVLIKGSRGMALERAVDALQARFAAAQQRAG